MAAKAMTADEQLGLVSELATALRMLAQVVPMGTPALLAVEGLIEKVNGRLAEPEEPVGSPPTTRQATSGSSSTRT